MNDPNTLPKLVEGFFAAAAQIQTEGDRVYLTAPKDFQSWYLAGKLEDNLPKLCGIARIGNYDLIKKRYFYNYEGLEDILKGMGIQGDCFEGLKSRGVLEDSDKEWFTKCLEDSKNFNQLREKFEKVVGYWEDIKEASEKLKQSHLTKDEILGCFKNFPSTNGQQCERDGIKNELARIEKLLNIREKSLVGLLDNEDQTADELRQNLNEKLKDKKALTEVENVARFIKRIRYFGYVHIFNANVDVHTNTINGVHEGVEYVFERQGDGLKDMRELGIRKLKRRCSNGRICWYYFGEEENRSFTMFPYVKDKDWTTQNLIDFLTQLFKNVKDKQEDYCLHLVVPEGFSNWPNPPYNKWNFRREMDSTWYFYVLDVAMENGYLSDGVYKTEKMGRYDESIFPASARKDGKMEGEVLPHVEIVFRKRLVYEKNLPTNDESDSEDYWIT